MASDFDIKIQKEHCLDAIQDHNLPVEARFQWADTLIALSTQAERPRTLLMKGEIAQDVGLTKDALQLFNEAIRLAPIDSTELRSLIYLRTAEVSFHRCNYRMATENALQALAINKPGTALWHNIKAYLLLGVLSKMQADIKLYENLIDEADKVFSRFKSTDASKEKIEEMKAAILTHRAVLKKELGDSVAAFSYYKEALKSPQAPKGMIYNNLGNFYKMINKYEMSLHYFSMAREAARGEA